MKRQARELLVAGILLLAAACGGSNAGPGSDGAGQPSSTTAVAPGGTLPAAPNGVEKMPLGEQLNSPPVEVDPSKTYLVDTLHTAFTLKPPAARLMATADPDSRSVVRIGPADGVSTWLMVLDAAQLRAFDDPYVAGSDRSTTEKLMARTVPLPADIAAWMAARPYVKDPETRAVTVGGLAGTEVEFSLNLPDGGPSCAPSGPRCALVFGIPANGFTPSISNREPQDRRRLIVLHAPAGDLVVVSSGRPEATAAVASLTFHRSSASVVGGVTTTTVAGAPAGARPVTDGLMLQAGTTYAVGDRTGFVVPFSVAAPVDGYTFETRLGFAVIGKDEQGLALADYSGTMRVVREPLIDHSSLSSQPELEAATAPAPADPLTHLKSLPFVEVVEDVHDVSLGGRPAHQLRFRIGPLGPRATACPEGPKRCAEIWFSTVGYLLSHAEGEVVTAVWFDQGPRRIYVEASGEAADQWLSSLTFLGP